MLLSWWCVDLHVNVCRLKGRSDASWCVQTERKERCCLMCADWKEGAMLLLNLFSDAVILTVPNRQDAVSHRYLFFFWVSWENVGFFSVSGGSWNLSLTFSVSYNSLWWFGRCSWSDGRGECRRRSQLALGRGASLWAGQVLPVPGQLLQRQQATQLFVCKG
jgi:hypothetical protein